MGAQLIRVAGHRMKFFRFSENCEGNKLAIFSKTKKEWNLFARVIIDKL